MNELDEVREWVMQTVRLIVESPEDVLVDAVCSEGQTTMRIQINNSDVGRVIGRQARTAQSIRVLAQAMGKKLGITFRVEIQDGRL